MEESRSDSDYFRASGSVEVYPFRLCIFLLLAVRSCREVFLAKPLLTLVPSRSEASRLLPILKVAAVGVVIIPFLNLIDVNRELRILFI